MSKDSEDELRIEKVRSEKEESFENVPQKTVYILKFKKANGKPYSLLEYDLREGVPLPYSAVIKGGICLIYIPTFISHKNWFILGSI